MEVGSLHESSGHPVGTLHAVDVWGYALCGARIGHTFPRSRFDPRHPAACASCALWAY